MDTSLAMNAYQNALVSQSKLAFNMEDSLNDLFGQTEFDNTLLQSSQDLAGFSAWPLTPPRSVKTEFVAPVSTIRAPEFTYSLPETFPNTAAWGDLTLNNMDESSLVLSHAFQPASTFDTKFLPSDIEASYDLDTLLKQMDENSDAVPLMNSTAFPNYDFTAMNTLKRRASTASLLSSEHMPELGLCDDFSAISESTSVTDFAFNTMITPDVSPRQGTVTSVQQSTQAFAPVQQQAQQMMIPHRASHSPPTSMRFPVDDGKARRATVAAYPQQMSMASMAPFARQAAMPMFPSQVHAMAHMHCAPMPKPAMASHISQAGAFIPSSVLNMYQQFKPMSSMMSHGSVGMLQSSSLSSYHSAHYLDNDPPDLYASLHEEQSCPPPEDMNPEDPDMIPHEQELRFEGDLYTPRWVRGHGNKREGWCGLCKPGRWLVLKNSAFWYDKSFSHGVSAATGAAFTAPEESRRMDGNPDVWEGLCGSCHEFVPLVSSKKKGTTWFRHAYKCHTHAKVKDTNKRKRESSQGHSRCVKQRTDSESGASPKIEEITDDEEHKA